MGELPSEKKKPLTRFGEFELLKAGAILGLPAIHVMEEIIEAGFGGPMLQTISGQPLSRKHTAILWRT